MSISSISINSKHVVLTQGIENFQNHNAAKNFLRVSKFFLFIIFFQHIQPILFSFPYLIVNFCCY